MGHDLKGRASAMLETFSGVITLAQAQDMPEGGSPRTTNTDFSVGSVFTRQGLENPFTYEGNNAGPFPGTAAVDTSLGGAVWSSPGNVLLNTGVYAQASVPAPLTVQTVSAFASGLGLPPNAKYFILVTFEQLVPAIGSTFTFAGLTTYTTLNGPPIISYAGGGRYLPTPTAYQALFSFGETVIPTQPATADTGTATTNAGGFTDAIDITNFGLSLPSTVTPQGFILNVNVQASSSWYLTAQLLRNGVPVGVVSAPIEAAGTPMITFGGINSLFGTTLSYSDLNNTGFGVRLQASSSTPFTAQVGYTAIQVFFVPSQVNFNYVTTYEDSFGNIKTLALDSNGDWWVEDVTNTPNVLAPLFLGPPAGSFASSFTASSRQYIAISDGSSGNYPPQQIVGATTGQAGWNDRVSQVGPGAAPSFSATLSGGNNVTLTSFAYNSGVLTLIGATNTLTAGEVIILYAPVGDPLFALNGLSYNVLGTGLSLTQFEITASLVGGSRFTGSTTATATGQYSYPIVASPAGITQYPFWNSAQGYQSQLDSVLWSEGPGSTNVGNVVTIYYLNAFTFQNGVDANLIKLMQQQLFPVYVYVSGTSVSVANGTQLVTSVGIGTPPGGTNQRYYFTFNVASTGYANNGGGSNAQPGQYQLTVATVASTLPLPGVQTGDTITISGAGIASWNNSWPVVSALNSGAYSISQTQMTTGVATYNWALSAGTTTPPVSGQLVTVTGTLNGNGVFNVTDAVIGTVVGSASGTFTISGFANQTFSLQVEDGQATTSGTKFQIDPGPLTLGNAADDPIYGNSGGGYITLVGSSSVVLGTGTRKGTVFFIDRNVYWTCPAPPVQFTINENTNYILASNIPIGPPNVVARAVVFTEAGQEGQPGASYYTIPTPVSFVYNGVTYLSSSLFINDNTTTSAKFTFPDTTLLNATEIDIEGGDLFSLGELGDAAWCMQYAGRGVWGRVRNKIQNFINLTFDGGYLPNPGGNILPLGWGYDPSNPSQSPATLLVSPVFGNSYYIKNITGSSAPQLGMITQTAYQDYNNAAILQNQTAYSVRVTCRTPSSTNVGALVIDLTEYDAGSGYGQTLGSFTLNTASMASNMLTYQGTLLTSSTLNIPADLLLRVWAKNLAVNGDIEIDRIEIFPTLAPVNLTSLTISYKDDWESFDLNTGGNDTSTVNAEPANGGFVMDGLLYIVKESSLGYLADTPNQEPANWNPFKEVSKIAGACGINAYDSIAEKWAIMANENGLYGFTGGSPTQIQLEIPNIWAAINWPYAQTLCVRNDAKNHRIFISCPMVTPNQWCPNFPVNDGTHGNNVTIYLNYEGIGTIEELIGGSAIHVTIVGKIAVHDMKRKWSLWSVPTPYIAICKRNELLSQMLICNGTSSSKIYQLGSYTAGNDDGVSFQSTYCTYPMVDATKAATLPLFGLFNKDYIYWTCLITGEDSDADDAVPSSMVFYQNTLGAPYPFTVPGGLPDLNPNAPADIEGNLDESCQRIFMELSATGGWWNLSRFTIIGKASAWSPLRGIGGGINGGY